MAVSMASQGFEQTDVSDEDRDSLSVLPLVIIPFENNALKRTRMIKNARLESVIELFDDADIGKGHIYPHEVDHFFSDVSTGDNSIIGSLAELPSYDVYSLRISLRNNGIEVDDHDHLRLSEAKQAELQAYMQPFLEQMTRNIFGAGAGVAIGAGNGADWRELFLHPDVRVTRQRLRAMSEKLGMPIHEVPGFLENYGDVYLSVAYYRQCLDVIKPSVVYFLRSAKEILEHGQLSRDVSVCKTCTSLRKKVERISMALNGQFAAVGASSDKLWTDASQQAFAEFRSMVKNGHDRIGALLCALTVKMNAWSKKFPEDEGSGPMRHADFMTTEMRQGW